MRPPSAPPSESFGSPATHDSNDDESDYHEGNHINPSTDGRHTRSRTASRTSRTKANRKAASKAPAVKSEPGKEGFHDTAHEETTDPHNARKMQNRLAQREFRARRMEHIKELEARVEFLSKPQSEQTAILVAIIQGLLDENKQLRGSLRSMATFVGSGIGGFSHEVNLPGYDDALDLVKRGDKALLLSLIHEKGIGVGATASQPSTSTAQRPQCRGLGLSDDSHHDNLSSTADSLFGSGIAAGNVGIANAAPLTAPAPAPAPARPHAADKKRKLESYLPAENNSTSKRNNGKAASAASHPCVLPSGYRSDTLSADISPGGSKQGGTYHPTNAMTDLTMGNNLPSAFPTLSCDTSLVRPASSLALLSGGVEAGMDLRTAKREDSPNSHPFSAEDLDSSSTAWLGAWTNLTPIGGNDAFWATGTAASSMPRSETYQQQDGSRSLYAGSMTIGGSQSLYGNNIARTPIASPDSNPTPSVSHTLAVPPAPAWTATGILNTLAASGCLQPATMNGSKPLIHAA